jgi:hypothetical protein
VSFPSGRLFLCCSLFLASLAPVLAQDSVELAASPASPALPSSVDELFKQPQADTEAQSSDAQQLFNPFRAQPLSVVGSLSSMAGVVAGYSDGVSDATGEYDGSYKFKMSPGLNFVPSLTFSARPDETIRFQGTVSFPFASSDTFAPTINEMFFDYTLRDLVYVRIGRHLVSWGVTRIFDAGGDLMTGSNKDLDLKITMPIGKGGVTGIVLAPSSLVDGQFSWRDMTYGLQVDLPVGSKSELILSGTCYGDDEDDRPLRATAVLKTSLYGVDLFAEGIGASRLDVNPEFAVYPNIAGFVSGFYWSRIEPNVELYGEYYLDATDTSMNSQFISVIAGMDRAFGTPFNLGLQWTHAFLDDSGIVMPGFSVGLWPHVKLQVGLPCRYGEPGSFYLVNQSPSVQTSIVPTKTLTWYQRYGLLLRLTMSTDF